MAVGSAVALVSAVTYGVTTAGCGYIAVSMVFWLRARHIALKKAVAWLQAAAVLTFFELALHLCYHFIVYSSVSGKNDDTDLHNSPEAHWQFASVAQLLQPIAFAIGLVGFNEMMLGLFHVQRGVVVPQSLGQRALVMAGAAVTAVLSIVAFALSEKAIAHERDAHRQFHTPGVAGIMSVAYSICLLAMAAVFIGFLFITYKKTAVFPDWVHHRALVAIVVLTAVRHIFMVARECVVAFSDISESSWIAIPTAILEGMSLAASLRFAHVNLLRCPKVGDDGTNIVLQNFGTQPDEDGLSK